MPIVTDSQFCEEKNMGKVNDKKLDKRLRLLKSARELFERNGVNLTAIDDVVKAAGVAKGTFYLYFKDKYDLVDQLIINEIRDILHGVAEKIAELELGCGDLYVYVFDRFLEYFKAHRSLVLLARKNMNACFTSLMSSEDETVRSDARVLAKPLIDSGADPEDVKLNFYLLSDYLGGVCSDAIIGASPFTPDEVAAKVRTMIRAACACAAGKEGADK